ncbi:MAG: macro domain-containing protein [Candidatus Hydrothermales bacterium]
MEIKYIKEKTISDKKVYICQGDITELNVEALVNPANERLKHMGGLAAHIVRKGGKIIQEESDKIGYCKVGEAVVTTGGNLKAKYVIHTVGPRWGEGNEEEKLKSAVRSSLSKGEDLKIKSIAIPAISTGIFGFPKDVATKIIVDTVKNFLENEAKSLKEVFLCDIDEKTVQYFENYL